SAWQHEERGTLEELFSEVAYWPSPAKSWMRSKQSHRALPHIGLRDQHGSCLLICHSLLGLMRKLANLMRRPASSAKQRQRQKRRKKVGIVPSCIARRVKSNCCLRSARLIRRS